MDVDEVPDETFTYMLYMLNITREENVMNR